MLEVRKYPLPLLQRVFATVEETPEAFRELAHRMFQADAFIIVTPEYNGSYSPAMQNMFDHFPKQHHKVFGLVTAFYRCAWAACVLPCSCNSLQWLCLASLSLYAYYSAGRQKV
jgi:hypothetical protein